MSRRPKENPEVDLDAKPSRAQRKRDLEQLRQLGMRLASLPPGKFDKVDLPEELRDALVEVRRLKDKNAIRRQFQYIQAVIDGCDWATILKSLESIDHKR